MTLIASEHRVEDSRVHTKEVMREHASTKGPQKVIEIAFVECSKKGS